MRTRFGFIKSSVLALLVLAVASAGPADRQQVAEVLETTGIKGGLIVHIGCGDGQLTAALGAGKGFIVQGLDTDARNIEKATKTITASGLYGRVTAREFDGRNLPYIDNLVNLVVSMGTSDVPTAEIMRVLAPRGRAYIDGKMMTKPWPEGLDEWTHFHHDPAGTMVGKDQVVGPPRRIQWLGEPKWLRNHDFMTVMNAMVSARGRIFYVIDEGLRNHIFLPSHWVLIARDAFNGTILWKKPLAGWYPHNWPLKSGPGHLPRKLVAVGDRVFVAAGLGEPVVAIDAATGRTLRRYQGTKPTQEIIFSDGVLYLLVDPEAGPINYRAQTASYKEIAHANSGWAWTPARPERLITAIRADSGEVLWKHRAPVAPLSLTVGQDKVFYHNGSALAALDRKTGRRLWVSAGPPVKSVPTGGSIRVSLWKDLVVFANGTKLTAFSAADGRQLWTGSLLKTSHHCPEDLFIIDGLIWSPNTGTPQRNGTHFKVIDVRTGQIKRDFVAKNLPAFPMHPRCYPGRATTTYIMTNGMGTEFYRIGDDKVDINHVVRGSCIYGVMPCNGLLYKPPDTCACYYQSKLEHLCALAPGRFEPKSSAVPQRLDKGPAYGYHLSAAGAPSSWPTYRGNPARTGYCRAAVSPRLKQSWRASFKGKLTQPVAAGGTVFVAEIDSQTLYALDIDSGKVVWQYTAAGRIDSPPTIYKGLVLFGCGDGRVYCLRDKDGALAWRYLVAPMDRQNVSYQRVESVWPVHGSVLVINDTVYALAGRNMFMDGGMRLVLLEPVTGRKISQTILDEKDPATGKNLQTLIQAKYMPVANDDVLSSDGERVYMQEQNFDLKGRRIIVAPTLPRGRKGPGTSGPKGKRHLFCQTGFLDDVWFHRSYLLYAEDCGEGWGAYAGPRSSNPSGRVMVLDDSRAYAFRSSPLGNMLLPRTTYHLYCCDKEPSPASAGSPQPKQARRGKAQAVALSIAGHKVHWQRESLPLLVNAMALAGKTLFIAGPPDLADETQMLGYLEGAQDRINRQLEAQDQAWRGIHGGLLWAVSAEDGKTLAQYKTESIPVSDGMSVAEGRVLISMIDGSLVCFEGR